MARAAAPLIAAVATREVQWKFLVVVSPPNADCNLSHYPVSKGSRNLKNANLSQANLRGSVLSNANFSG